MNEKAYFAAGCFWGVQKAFDDLAEELPSGGIKETTVGYMGGEVENPTYKQVCGGDTGHAEAIEVIYDPEKVNYETLVNKFLEIHNPTQLNRQGPDVGHQYRSGVFYTTDEQKEIALNILEELDGSGKYEREVVTEVESAGDFWRAEDHHQKYYIEHPGVC
jgi:peptide-methionine (S)-S-oxide reductase